MAPQGIRGGPVAPVRGPREEPSVVATRESQLVGGGHVAMGRGAVIPGQGVRIGNIGVRTLGVGPVGLGEVEQEGASKGGWRRSRIWRCG